MRGEGGGNWCQRGGISYECGGGGKGGGGGGGSVPPPSLVVRQRHKALFLQSEYNVRGPWSFKCFL